MDQDDAGAVHRLYDGHVREAVAALPPAIAPPRPPEVGQIPGLRRRDRRKAAVERLRHRARCGAAARFSAAARFIKRGECHARFGIDAPHEGRAVSREVPPQVAPGRPNEARPGIGFTRGWVRGCYTRLPGGLSLHRRSRRLRAGPRLGETTFFIAPVKPFASRLRAGSSLGGPVTGPLRTCRLREVAAHGLTRAVGARGGQDDEQE